MKKTILRLVIAITMMAMPKVCSAQGLLINSTGMLPWKPVPYNNQRQKNLQQNQKQYICYQYYTQNRNREKHQQNRHQYDE